MLDVRTSEEFASDPVGGFVHAPGGQLVQATDQWVGVLVADPPTLAALVAVDLAEAGHRDVRVLAGDAAIWRAAGLPVAE